MSLLKEILKQNEGTDLIIVDYVSATSEVSKKNDKVMKSFKSIFEKEGFKAQSVSMFTYKTEKNQVLEYIGYEVLFMVDVPVAHYLKNASLNKRGLDLLDKVAKSIDAGYRYTENHTPGNKIVYFLTGEEYI